MPVSTRFDNEQSALVISVQGKFDFSDHIEFRDSYEKSTADAKRYIIDLADASYLDSSALGMLLLLRDYAGGDHADIEIIHCNEDIRKILTISNFQQLFSVS